jgi:hypothetical protein
MSQENSTSSPTPAVMHIPVRSIKQLQNEFDKVLLLDDRHVIKVVAAFAIANLTGRDPFWLFLVGPSSGGKTEILNSINKLDKVFPVDTLTVNTFASGQKSAGKETSLLLKMNGGILTFKDFTAILETNQEARREIMSQLRCIFDGEFVKRTGTGDDIIWKGKVSLIAAVTSIIHEKAKEFASMGERFVQYSISQPDRKEMTKRKFQNSYGMEGHRSHLQDCMKEYVEHVRDTTEDRDFKLDDNTMNDIIDLADFASKARSGLAFNERSGKISFIPDSEMPTRIASQLIILSAALMRLNMTDDVEAEPQLLPEDHIIIQKIALDSIPRKRRQALQLLAKYKMGVTAAAMATQMNYDTEVMKQTLQELCALKLATRISRSDTYYYTLLDEYRDIIEKFENITAIEEELSASDAKEEDTTDTDQEINDAFNITFE